MRDLEVTRSALGNDFPEFLATATRLGLDSRNVPDSLRALIPFAEIWGLADDYDRDNLVVRTPIELMRTLVHHASEAGDELDAWLAGPEADLSDPTPEYVAFSAFRMAVDYMSVIAKGTNDQDRLR